jgi:hypothetical protein
MVVTVTLWPLFPLEGDNSTYSAAGCVDVVAGLDGVWKISSSLGINPRTVQPLAIRYADYAGLGDNAPCVKKFDFKA